MKKHKKICLDYSKTSDNFLNNLQLMLRGESLKVDHSLGHLQHSPRGRLQILFHSLLKTGFVEKSQQQVAELVGSIT